MVAFDILGYVDGEERADSCRNSTVNHENCQVNPWMYNKRHWLGISTALGEENTLELKVTDNLSSM